MAKSSLKWGKLRKSGENVAISGVIWKKWWKMLKSRGKVVEGGEKVEKSS